MKVDETLWGVQGVSETPDALTSDIRPSLSVLEAVRSSGSERGKSISRVGQPVASRRFVSQAGSLPDPFCI